MDSLPPSLRLQALKRELKVKELHVLDAARRRFLEHQQVTREDELRKMDENIKKKVLHREKETQAVLQDIETRAVELERQKALLEVELNRCQEEVSIEMRDGKGRGWIPLVDPRGDGTSLSRKCSWKVEKKGRELQVVRSRLDYMDAWLAKALGYRKLRAVAAIEATEVEAM
jgi:hypothetical protein